MLERRYVVLFFKFVKGFVARAKELEPKRFTFVLKLSTLVCM